MKIDTEIDSRSNATSHARVWSLTALALVLAACGGSSKVDVPAKSAASIEGQLLALDGGPLAGARIATPDGRYETHTDDFGAFELKGISDEDAATGQLLLEIDASRATPASSFALTMPFPVDAGSVTELPLPMYLPVSGTQRGTRIHGLATQTAYAGSEHPGASITVAADGMDLSQATLVAGATTEVSMVHIPRHRLPGAMPNGMASDVVFSIQPSGAVFDPPAAVTFPNYDDFEPNEQVPLMQVDPSTGQWVQVGTARVNAAGTLIESEPGSGARWGSCTGCCYMACTGTIRGRVVIRATPEAGPEPAPGVVVFASGAGGALTDENGEYVLENVVLGNCQAAGNQPLKVTVSAALQSSVVPVVQTRELEVDRTTLGPADSSGATDWVGVADFEFAGLSIKFVDDSNDGQASILGAFQGNAPAIVAVAADGTTSLAIDVDLPTTNVQGLELRVWSADIPIEGVDRGRLTRDLLGKDGHPGSDLATDDVSGWLSVALLEKGAAPVGPSVAQGYTLRYVAPAEFGVPEAPHVSQAGASSLVGSRDQRRVRFNAAVREPLPGGGWKIVYSTLQPTELIVVRPQPFLVHGILSGPGVWATQAQIELETATEDPGVYESYKFTGCQGWLAEGFAAEGRAQLESLLRPWIGDDDIGAYLADYESIHMERIATTAKVVTEQLEGLRAHLRGQRIAATRFDVIAHSYGGLNIRHLIEAVREQRTKAGPLLATLHPYPVRKLATFGTPHLGSTASDRILNLLDPQVPGAAYGLWFFETALESFKLVGCEDSSHAAVIQAMRESANYRSAHHDIASAERTLAHHAQEGLVDEVEYRFFYSVLGTDSQSKAYENLGWLYGHEERPGDGVVSIESATAGSTSDLKVEELAQGTHSNLVQPKRLANALAWFGAKAGKLLPPVQEPDNAGPLIQHLSAIAFDVHSDWSLVIKGRNLRSPTGAPTKVYFPPRPFIPFTPPLQPGPFVVPASAIVDDRIVLSAATTPIPFADLQLIGSGYLFVDVDGVRSNRVHVEIGETEDLEIATNAPLTLQAECASSDCSGAHVDVSEIASHVKSGEWVVRASIPVVAPQGWSDVRLSIDGLGLEVLDAEYVPGREDGVTHLLDVAVPLVAGSGDLVVSDGLGTPSRPLRLELPAALVPGEDVSARVGETVMLEGVFLGHDATRLEVLVSGVEQGIVRVDGRSLVFVVADGTQSGPIVVLREGAVLPNAPALLVDADSDKDRLTDEWEIFHGLDPHEPSDASSDADADALVALAEFEADTDPNSADTDGGGLGDGFEVQNGLHPTDAADDVPDADGDGLVVDDELELGTSVSTFDTDGDQLGDGDEVLGSFAPATDPLEWDTDGDGISDGTEVLSLGTHPANTDTDGDGLTDGAEMDGTFAPPTNPTLADSDGDLLDDGDEVSAGSDPSDPDTDQDSLADGVEVTVHGTDPLKSDSDGDGLDDGHEVALGVDPLAADTTASVSGTVVTTSGKPIAGAVVLVVEDVTAHFTTSTDANGAFTLPPWPSVIGPLHCRAEHTSPQGTFTGTSAAIDVSPGGAIGGVEIVLDTIVVHEGPLWPLAHVHGALPDVAIHSLASADMDADGDLDHVVSSGQPAKVHVVLADESGWSLAGTTASPASGPMRIAVGRIDADRHPDVVGTDAASDRVFVFLSNGDGTLQNPLTVDALAPIHPAVDPVLTDVDGNATLDVLVGTGHGVLEYANVSGGDLAAPQLAVGAQAEVALVASDLDGDLDEDVVLASDSYVVSVEQLGTAFGSIEPIEVGAEANGLALGDVVGDALPEVAIVRGAPGRIDVHTTIGDELVEYLTIQSAVHPKAVVVADIDDNGEREYVSFGEEVVAFEPRAALEVFDLGGGFGYQSAAFELGSGSIVDVSADSRPGAADSIAVAARWSGAFDDRAAVLELSPADRGTVAGLEFVVASSIAASVGVAFGDLDGDGRRDLVRGSLGEGLVVHPGQADGSLGDGVVVAAVPVVARILVADIDGDGLDDIVAIENTAIGFHRSVPGLQTFTSTSVAVTPQWHVGHQAKTGDLDGDGDLELVVPTTAGHAVITRTGAWTFAVATTVTWTTGGALNGRIAGTSLADLDGDGRLDLATLPFFGSSSTGAPVAGFDLLVRAGDGHMGFGPTQHLELSPETALFVGFDLECADVDGDSVLDAVVRYATTGTTSIARMALVRGMGTSHAVTTIESTTAGQGSTFAEWQLTDLDGDQRADIVGRRSDQPLEVRRSLGADFAPGEFYGLPPLGAVVDMPQGGVPTVALEMSSGCLVLHGRD